MSAREGVGSHPTTEFGAEAPFISGIFHAVFSDGTWPRLMGQQALLLGTFSACAPRCSWAGALLGA